MPPVRCIMYGNIVIISSVLSLFLIFSSSSTLSMITLSSSVVLFLPPPSSNSLIFLSFSAPSIYPPLLSTSSVLCLFCLSLSFFLKLFDYLFLRHGIVVRAGRSSWFFVRSKHIEFFQCSVTVFSEYNYELWSMPAWVLCFYMRVLVVYNIHGNANDSWMRTRNAHMALLILIIIIINYVILAVMLVITRNLVSKPVING